jgi:type II secretory pathway predicted ATPase ExeA
MDLAHFGLGRRPFRPAPAPELFFPAGAHAAAADRLRAAFDAGDGIALLDGGPGTGKTAVAVRFLESLGPTAVPVFLPSGRVTRPSDLHQAILFDLGLPYQGLGETELRLAVTGHWLGELAAGRRGAVVIDEAHHLGPDALEEVRLLDNLGGRGAKAVFTLLVGLPGLRDRLARPEFEPLAQRISCRVRLAPLPQDEAAAYLCHQVTACGGAADRLLTPEAAGLIAEYALGVPRVLNQLAAAAFDLAAEGGEQVVDVEAVCEAADRLELRPADPAPAAHPAGAAESGPGEDGEDGEGDEPGRSRGPKQKARRRRAA